MTTARALLTSGYTVFAAAALGSALGLAPLRSRAAAVVLLTVAAGVGVGVAWWASARGAERATSVRWRWRGGVSYGEPAEDAMSGERRALTRLCGALAAAGLVATLLTVALALALPVGAYDALGYRLPAVAQWLDAGAVAWVSGDDPLRNGYPLALEVIEAVVFRAFDSAAGVDAVAPLFVLAGAAALTAFARFVGALCSAALLAGGLFSLAPMHLLNAPSGYADAAFAGALVCAFAAAARFAFADEHARAELFDLGIASAFVIALKPHGFAFAALALAFAVVARVRSVGVRAELGALALLVAPGLFFAVRNVVRAGNPLYPLEVSLLGRVLLPGESPLEGILTPAFNVPRELAELPALLRPLVVWIQPYGPARSFDDRLAGLGYAFPLLALPALVWLGRALFRSLATREARAVAAVLALTASCFALQPFAFWPRFTSWLWGAGGLAIALSITALARSLHGREAVVAAALALLVALPEALYALAHVKGLHRLGLEVLRREPFDQLSLVSGVPPAFFERALLGHKDLCRTPWRLGTDDANLDGVVAQLVPRPRMHIVAETTPSGIAAALAARGCTELIAIGEPPFLHEFSRDRRARVEAATAFGRCHVLSLSSVPQVTP